MVCFFIFPHIPSIFDGFDLNIGEAAAIDNNTGRDYWMGGLRTADGWKWMSGAPMDYTNWVPDNPGGVTGGNFTSFLRNDYPTYYWNVDVEENGDNAVICEMKPV